MARRERTPPADGTRVPSSLPPPNRAFVMASEALWKHFHAEWRAIEQRYPHFGPDFTEEERDAFRSLREHARDALRAEAKMGVETLGFAGPYLIPV